jgi:hypothetical protein
MTRATLLLIVLTLALAAAAGSATEKHQAQGEPGNVTVLDDDASQLREDFNRAQGSVRLVLIVDPICPTCLRGLADVDAALLAGTPDPRLQTFVVHLPVIGAKAENVPPASELLHNPNVHHYWDPSGNFGHQITAALQLKRGDKLVYAWDVWMIYTADAVWKSAPPPPALFMHQLPTLPGNQFLDADEFAAKARALLNGLPARGNVN